MITALAAATLLAFELSAVVAPPVPLPLVSDSPVTGVQESYEALVEKSKSLLADGKASEAKTLLLRALASASGKFEAHMYLGIACFQLGEYKESVAHFANALSRAPESEKHTVGELKGTAERELGYVTYASDAKVAYEAGQLYAAATLYTKAFETKPEGVEAGMSAVLLYKQLQAWENHTIVFQKVIAKVLSEGVVWKGYPTISLDMHVSLADRSSNVLVKRTLESTSQDFLIQKASIRSGHVFGDIPLLNGSDKEPIVEAISKLSRKCEEQLIKGEFRKAYEHALQAAEVLPGSTYLHMLSLISACKAADDASVANLIARGAKHGIKLNDCLNVVEAEPALEQVWDSGLPVFASSSIKECILQAYGPQALAQLEEWDTARAASCPEALAKHKKLVQSLSEREKEIYSFVVKCFKSGQGQFASVKGEYYSDRSNPGRYSVYWSTLKLYPEASNDPERLEKQTWITMPTDWRPVLTQYVSSSDVESVKRVMDVLGFRRYRRTKDGSFMIGPDLVMTFRAGNSYGKMEIHSYAGSPVRSFSDIND